MSCQIQLVSPLCFSKVAWAFQFWVGKSVNPFLLHGPMLWVLNAVVHSTLQQLYHSRLKLDLCSYSDNWQEHISLIPCHINASLLLNIVCWILI
jgi:hypothetical protein